MSKRRFIAFIAFITLSCLFFAFAACGTEPDSADKARCEVGRIVRFDPFGDEGVTVVEDGDDVAFMINDCEAMIIGAGDFTLKAAAGERSECASFVAVPATEQITSRDIVFYIGESVVPVAKKIPSGEDCECAISVLSGDFTTVDGNMLTANKTGEGQLLLREKNGDRAVTVKVTALRHSLGMDIEFAQLYAGRTLKIVPIFSDGVSRETIFSVEYGFDAVSINDNTITALKEGRAIIGAMAEGEYYRFSVNVLAEPVLPPSLCVDDVEMALGESVEPKLSAENAGDNPRFEYEIIAGSDIIKIKNGTLTALKVGSARVICRIVGTEISDEFCVEVTCGEYKLRVENVTVKASFTVSPVPELTPRTDGINFEYEIRSGGEYVEIVQNSVRGVAPGQAVVRCVAIELNVFADFSVLVKSAEPEIPKGYVKISDYIYASAAPGRYSSDTKLDFFTPLEGAEIYYTTDSSPVSADFTNAALWAAPRFLTARRGLLSDYKLTRQVDAALTWAGGSKDYSTAYVNRMQYGGEYSLVNLGYVFNLAVKYDGKAVDRKTASYILPGNSDFDDVPVISLSAPVETWFDGIENGLGTSVYNNVYLPGTNTAADNVGRANLEFFDTDNSGFSVNTQVKVGGGWSRGRPQRTLHLNFNKDENGKKQSPVNFEIFGDRSKRNGEGILDEFTRFRLWNGGSRYDSGMRFNDAFLQLVAEDLNVATSAVRPVVVYINGEFWGTYYLREHYADVYFKNNYDVKKGDVQYFDYVGGKYEVSDGDEDAANEFIAEMNAFLSNPEKNFGDDDVYNEFFSKYVDEESMIDYIIVQTWCGNWDGVGNRNNHRLWRVSKQVEGNEYTDGKLRFILHDLDMGMLGDATLNGQYKNLLSVASSYSVANYNVFNRALSNEGFRNRLYARAAELAANQLSYAKTSAVLKDLANSVKKLINYNVTRWAQGQSVAQWENELKYGDNWLLNRNDIYLEAIRKTLAVYTEEPLPSGDGIILKEKEVRVNQFYAGNGSLVGSGRYEIRNISAVNYEISYTLINNGLKDCSGQFHAKFIYGSGGSDNYVTRILRNGRESVIFTDVKASGSTKTSTEFGDLYEGVHKIRYVKLGTTLSVYVDSVKAYDVEVPYTAITGIDLYQHTANAIYRNLVIRKL